MTFVHLWLAAMTRKLSPLLVFCEDQLVGPLMKGR